MEYKRLGDLIKFSMGNNTTRIKNTGADLYTQEDFEQDLSGANGTCSDQVCIINLIRSKAAPISKLAESKQLTANFLSCSLPKEIDPWYFCYQFNESRNFSRQILMCSQGTTTSVKRLNVQAIADMQMQLPDIKKQKTIGELYKQSILQNALLLKQAENIKTFMLSMIRKIEED